MSTREQLIKAYGDAIWEGDSKKALQIGSILEEYLRRESLLPTVDRTEWDVFRRTGYGERNYWQEYSLDLKGYVLVYTDSFKPEFPEHIPYIEETKKKICLMDRGMIYQIALVE